MSHGQDDLVRLLSRIRLHRYIADCDGDVAAAVRLYAWNMEVSAAFLGPLNCAEVVMRNAMHDQLSRLFGGPVWWDHPRMALLGPGQNGIDVVKQRLSLRPGPIIADQVIAELTFGFWVSLLGRGNNYETRL